MLTKELPPNNIGKDYVVGDLHGCYSLLMQELKTTQFDFNKDRLFSVGDLVDRGTENLECLSLIKEDWFHSIRGNHEEMLIDHYTGYYRFQTNPSRLYAHNGGLWFFDTDADKQKEAYLLANSLPYVIETVVEGHSIGFVHANPPQIWSNVLNDLHSRVWERAKINNMDESFVEGIGHIFLGHTPIKSVTTLGNCTYIDTGAVFGNKLSVICINDFIKDKINDKK